jgi:hypothetical protein
MGQMVEFPPAAGPFFLTNSHKITQYSTFVQSLFPRKVFDNLIDNITKAGVLAKSQF